MLSNAYFLARFRFDTAENEPAKNLQNLAISATPNPLLILGRARDRRGGGEGRARGHDQGPLSGKLYRARSRRYRSQNLQENMRWKALAEIYTMHSFAQLCNLNVLSNFANSYNLLNLLSCKIQQF